MNYRQWRTRPRDAGPGAEQAAPRESWLDRAIGWLSPALALRRARTRTAARLMERLGYEGVRSERRQGGWLTRGTSGNAEIGPALAKLRDNARDLARNNAYGRRAVNEWSKRVVGTGIQPRAKTGNDAVDAKINALWSAWVTQCVSDRRMNFYALQKVMVSSAFVSGEVFIRLWDRREEDKLPVPFQIQVLEADYVDHAKTQTTDTGYIIQGVDFDGIGRVRGYWLFGQHPGDTLATSARGLQSKFVSAEHVLHYAEFDRPGDVHAVTRFAPVIAKLRDIDEAADAYIVRAKMQACMVAAVTSASGGDGPTVAPAITGADGKRIESFEPGMVLYGNENSDIKFNNPSGTGDFSAHKKSELREVASGLGIPYILLDDNLEAVNYSSGRLGLVAYITSVTEHQWNWFIPQVLDPIWRRFIDRLVVMGAIRDANYGHVWDTPVFNLLDREAEAKADRLELQLGKMTWPQYIGAQGEDPEKHLKEIAEWRPRLEEAGVSFAQSVSKSEDGGSNAADGNSQAAA